MDQRVDSPYLSVYPSIDLQRLSLPLLSVTERERSSSWEPEVRMNKNNPGLLNLTNRLPVLIEPEEFFHLSKPFFSASPNAGGSFCSVGAFFALFSMLHGSGSGTSTVSP